MASAYSPQQKRIALEILAANSKMTEPTRRMLDEVGLNDLRVDTVREWARRGHKDEYDQIRQELEAWIRTNTAERFRAITSMAHDVQEEGLRQIKAALQRGELKPTEIPRALQPAAVAAGIAIDKSELLSDRPTERVSHDVGDLRRELASVGVTIIMPGEPEQTRPRAIDVQTRQPEALPVAVDGKDEGKDD
jgi:hypothetical protein